MELLKKSIVVLFIIATIATQAQTTTEVMQKAFLNSYTNETKGDFVAAIKNIKDIYDANSYEMNLRLGWLTYSNTDYSESANYYLKAIQLQPMSEEARMGYIMPLSAVGKWDEILKTYLEILKLNPYNTTVLYYTGLIYYNKAQYSQAFPYFEKVVNLYPFTYNGLLMLAWTNFKLGKYADAKALFNKILLLSPDDASAKEGLSLIK